MTATPGPQHGCRTCGAPDHPSGCREDFQRHYMTAPGPQQPDEVLTGVQLIAAERRRQVEQEGWTPEHDRAHADDAMALAAAVYALPARRRGRRAVPHPGNNGDRGDAWRYAPAHWPWDPEWFKPTPDDRVRELVKAGALIAAEIDRLQSIEPDDVPTADRLARWLNDHPKLTGVTDGTRFVGTTPAAPSAQPGEVVVDLAETERDDLAHLDTSELYEWTTTPAQPVRDTGEGRR